jgi:hypothetical protein
MESADGLSVTKAERTTLNVRFRGTGATTTLDRE